jgi:hypothetical protein
MMLSLLFCLVFVNEYSSNYLNRDDARNFLKGKYPFGEFTSRQESYIAIFTSFFHDIRSQTSGGALYLSNSFYSALVTDCCFCFVSTSSGNGGAMCFKSGVVNVLFTRGYQCEASSSDGYGTYLFLYLKKNYNNHEISSVQYNVIHRCPNEYSKYLTDEEHSTICAELSSIVDFEIYSSNFSHNYHTGSHGHIKILNAGTLYISLNTIADNKIAKSGSLGFFEYSNVSRIYFSSNNILRNSANQPEVAMIYIDFGNHYDDSNYISWNSFRCYIRTHHLYSGYCYLGSSYFGSNNVATIGEGVNYNVYIQSGSPQISPTFDRKCWLYYSLFSSDFRGAYEEEINLDLFQVTEVYLTPASAKSYLTALVIISIIAGLLFIFLLIMICCVFCFLNVKKQKIIADLSQDDESKSATDAMEQFDDASAQLKNFEEDEEHLSKIFSHF